VIIGASGFGRELLQYVRDAARASAAPVGVRGFLDDDPSKSLGSESEDALGARILGNTRDYTIQPDDRFLISIGDSAVRQAIFKRLEDRGAEFFTLIHPTSYVADTAKIEPGCIIGPFATVGSFARLGQNVLLNLYAVAGHDVQIGSHCVFSPHSVVNGGSLIGERVFFGTNAATAAGVRIGSDSKVSAGSVVYHDAGERTLVTGNPAKSYPISGTTPPSEHPAE
jgi:sugar O-acyltransferase (sialic acid O-acetyltransferase NeuD family)